MRTGGILAGCRTGAAARPSRTRQLSLLEERLASLEQRLSHGPVDTAGWIKVAAAVLLPFLVLIATGSLEAAVKTARLIGAAG